LEIVNLEKLLYFVKRNCNFVYTSIIWKILRIIENGE